MRRLDPRSSALALVGLVFGCSPSEAPRVELPVVVDSSGIEATTTDLGWTVELDEARVVISELLFTTAGELHEERRPAGVELIGRWSELIVSTAWAHPGHQQGGEVIGELPGTHVIDFAAEDGRALGLATLIAGEYTAITFGLGRAEAGVDADAGLSEDDPLIGHTALLRGTASKQIEGETVEVAFTILIDSPLDREILGAPFEASVDETSDFSIGLRMLTRDPIEGDALFDGLDFAALDGADGEADGALLLVDPETGGAPDQPGALGDAYYDLRREFQTHDFFDATPHMP